MWTEPRRASVIMASYTFTSTDSEQIDAQGNKPSNCMHMQGSLSTWSNSRSKRLFDVACVLLALPAILPLISLTALAVRLTSAGPVFFRQKREGRYGRLFLIYKFRTMPVQSSLMARPSFTTSTNQEFTPIGPFLRRWKLDELPQVFNVLGGDMSLVGPRPKLPSHQLSQLPCRPGITGYSTCVFAREEAAFASLSEHELNSINSDVILPLKERLDREYMSIASCSSDLNLIFKSIFRSWDREELWKFILSVDCTDSSDSGETKPGLGWSVQQSLHDRAGT